MSKLNYLIFLLLCVAGTLGYYIPGTYPNEYEYGQIIQAQVNSLKSLETELPYDYYSLPFCKPKEGVRPDKEKTNLGTSILGLRIQNSPYKFQTMINETEKNVCTGDESPKLDKFHLRDFKSKIDQDYYVNLILDNLPVKTVYFEGDVPADARTGYKIGFKHGHKYYINNHLIFTILIHESHGQYVKEFSTFSDPIGVTGAKRKILSEVINREFSGRGLRQGMSNENKGDSQDSLIFDESENLNISENDRKYMIVGFEVIPCSLKKGLMTEKCFGKEEGNIENKMELTENIVIPYTYDVNWEQSKIAWASRWDSYLMMSGGKVHWFSIINSLLVVLVMAVLCFMIIIRTVRKDLAQYEELIMESSKSAEIREEAGWKLVTGDVFRAPSNSNGLIIRIGSGVQIILTFLVTLFFAAVGFLSPAHRGSLLSALLVIYLLLAVSAGFSSVWLSGMIMRTYEGWKGVCWRVSTYFPGITFMIFTIINILIKHTGSTGAVPVSTYFTLVLLWFIFSIPLTFVGGYFAKKIAIQEYPVRTNQIPRLIPKPTSLASPWVLFLVAGLLPFGTLFIELYFVMTSFWMGYFYYLFGYLMLIGFLTFIVTVEVSILCTYVQLCAEDYLWWWRSFYRGGSIALYILIYTASFFFTTLHNLNGFISTTIFLCYMGIIIWGILLATGTIGFLSSFFFTYMLFKYVKLD